MEEEDILKMLAPKAPTRSSQSKFMNGSGKILRYEKN